LVLILEPVEPPVNRIEVPEHLPSQLADHLAEPEIHVGQSSIDVGELPTEEFDELPIFGRAHGSSLSQVADAFKSRQWEVRGAARGDRAAAPARSSGISAERPGAFPRPCSSPAPGPGPS